MATRQQIYNQEYYVLNAAESILNKNGITTTMLDMDGEDTRTPRVELKYSLGSPTGHAQLSGSGPGRAAELDAWNAQLTALVVTDRAWNSGSHREYVAKCRSLLGDYRNFNNETGSMPYHHIVKSNNVNTQLTIDGKINEDLTALVFEQILYVKPNAW